MFKTFYIRIAHDFYMEIRMIELRLIECDKANWVKAVHTNKPLGHCNHILCDVRSRGRTPRIGDAQLQMR